MNTTTRKFPRTMNEAFGEPGCISGPYRNHAVTIQRLLWVAITLAVIVVVGLDVLVWRP